MNRRFWPRLLLAFLLLAAIGGGRAEAAGNAPTPTSPLPGVSKDQPVLMTAREVGYDEKNYIAVAIGNVEVVQGDTILLADEVDYNQKTDTVHAKGHVSILQPSGDVLFSNDAVLTQKMQKGVVKQFRARLKDNSLFAAREGQKLSKNVTVMHDGVYSPCKVCASVPGEPDKAPLWQMQADTITLDENQQRVIYRNAFAEIYGVPVLYTPYFSSATPDAPSQSGLLLPQYFNATDLGNVVKQPVYISIAPNMDMTLTPWYLSGEKPLLEAEFRHLLTDGSYEIRGAITDTYNRDAYGNIIPGSEIRGYIDAHGQYQLDKYWDAGIDVTRTTDDTFLQLYRFAFTNILTSRIYAERIDDRDYAVIQAMAFQGLDLQDVRAESPYILPQGILHMESDPLEDHSRFTLDASELVLERQEGDSDQRVSSTVGWKIPYVTRDGQVMEASATLRGDAYNINDQVINTTTGATFSGQDERVIPQIDLNWRYPFINRYGEQQSVQIAPVVEFTASPNMAPALKIPNEDSQVSELSDLNLFSPDRFTGLDEVESGLRGTYGTRGQWQYEDEGYVQWLLGQTYQQYEQSAFPIASTYNTHFSDYIARLAFKYHWIDIAYTTTVDRETLAPTRNEINTVYQLSPLTFDATYVELRNDPLFGDRQEVFGSTTLEVTQYWRWMVGGRYDLGSTEETGLNPSLPISATNPLTPSDGTVGLSTSIIFHNECMMVSTSIGRNYISELDVKPSTTVSVLVTLKNFGNSDAAGSNATNTLGAGNIQPTSSGSSGVNSTDNGVLNTGYTSNSSGGDK